MRKPTVWRPGFLLAVLLAGAGSYLLLAGLRPAPPAKDLPGSLAEHLRKQDAPDLAWELMSEKRRAWDGQNLSLYERYLSAQKKLDQLPRYSTRLGRRLDQDLSRSSLRRARWEPLGPGNIGGRTRAMLLDWSNSERIFAGGVSGGIWRMEDGDPWEPLADLLPNIAVNSLAQDPINPDVLYAGTGEGYFREIERGTGLPLRGAGILKTTDRGEHWSRLESTRGEDFYWVNDLVVSHVDPSRVYAATRSGVWRSDDSGLSWQQVLRTTVLGGCLDLVARRDGGSDYLTVACGTFEQAFVSQNTEAESDGAWETVLTEVGMGRTVLAISKSNPSVLYALSTSYIPGPNGRFNGGLHAVFRSDRGGVTGSWRATTRNTNPNKLNTLLLTNPVIANLVACGFGASDQYSTLGWHASVLAVDPLNPEIVFAGGVDLFRSDDGGRNWGPISHWAFVPPSAHADQHAIVFHPDYDGATNQTMFVANDGGVYRTDNARASRSTGPEATCSPEETDVEWTAMNRNFGITQFYHGAPFPDGESFLGGTQDNGTVLGDRSSGVDGWTRILGGDGGYVAVHPGNPAIIYAESQLLSLAKSVDDGPFENATSGITDTNANFLFIVPFTMDPTNPDRLWIGGQRLWRTNNGADFWFGASRTFPGGGKVSAIAISPSNPDKMLVGLDTGGIFRQDKALSTNATSLWLGGTPRQGFVTWIAFHPTEEDVAYATYAGFGGSHVWKTTDAGLTWTSVDGTAPHGLPDIPVHHVLISPYAPHRVYLGTDLGVLVAKESESGYQWQVELTGFPRTVTESLSLLERPGQDPKLFAFTHGRGAWSVELTQIDCEAERWIPHVTPPDVEFSTRILATNLGAQSQSLELFPFSEMGAPLSTTTITLEPNATLDESSRDLFPGESVSHFGICGDASVAVSAGYRIENSAGITAHTRETSIVATEYLIYPGEWDQVFDGIALVNRGAEPAAVVARLESATGEVVSAVTLTDSLAPDGKLLAVLDAVFLGQEGSRVRITSSQPGVFLSLRGTRPEAGPQRLWETAAVVVQ